MWLIGGAALANTFRQAGLIDRYILSIIPTLLGDGIPLFGSSFKPKPLNLIDGRTFTSGLVQLTYEPDT